MRAIVLLVLLAAALTSSRSEALDLNAIKDKAKQFAENAASTVGSLKDGELADKAKKFAESAANKLDNLATAGTAALKATGEAVVTGLEAAGNAVNERGAKTTSGLANMGRKAAEGLAKGGEAIATGLARGGEALATGLANGKDAVQGAAIHAMDKGRQVLNAPLDFSERTLMLYGLRIALLFVTCHLAIHAVTSAADLAVCTVKEVLNCRSVLNLKGKDPYAVPWFVTVASACAVASLELLLTQMPEGISTVTAHTPALVVLLLLGTQVIEVSSITLRLDVRLAVSVVLLFLWHSSLGAIVDALAAQHTAVTAMLAVGDTMAWTQVAALFGLSSVMPTGVVTSLINVAASFVPGLGAVAGATATTARYLYLAYLLYAYGGYILFYFHVRTCAIGKDVPKLLSVAPAAGARAFGGVVRAAAATAAAAAAPGSEAGAAAASSESVTERAVSRKKSSAA